jgi:hypothetical protein
VVAPAANTGNSSGSGGSTSTGSANTWQFNDGSQLFSGTDSATVNTVTSPVTETALVISGGTMTGDTTISLSVGILGSASIKTGTYTSSIYVINGISNVIYQPTTTGQGLQVIITSYNSNTKIVQGTFSGSVQNSSGATKNITGGSFNARIVN